MMFEQELDLVLNEIMTRWDVPGMAVGIVEGGKIVSTRTLGVQNLDTHERVKLDSVFCIQSVTKCLVATAILQWVELGKIDLDTPLVQYLPYFQMDDRRYQQITVRQVLSHTSGMPDFEEAEYVDWIAKPEYDEGAAERFVRSLSGRKLIADPGARFSYSNIGYNVLGDLLAKMAQMSFESAMEQQILVACGMGKSTFSWKEVPPDSLSVPHLRSPGMKTNPIYPYQRADAPASFLHTTVVDLCQWAIACLDQGRIPGGRLLSPAGFDLMWTAVANRGNRKPNIYEEMGLGWTLGHFNGERTVSHGGAGFGGSSFLMLLPDLGRAAVVLCNEESDAHYYAVQAAADALTGKEPRQMPVSWQVPISRALARGGTAAAYACIAEIKDNKESFFFGRDDLLALALQLFMANQVDMAIDVLGLNIHVFPDFVDSYTEQARLYLRKGDLKQGKKSLQMALSLDPVNVSASRLLASIP